MDSYATRVIQKINADGEASPSWFACSHAWVYSRVWPVHGTSVVDCTQYWSAMV